MYDCRPANEWKPGKTALAQHRFTSGHDFDFQAVKILHKESNRQKRLWAESWHIKKEDDAVNYRIDTHVLNPILMD